MSIRWLQGDCRETLRTLDAGSVQCVVTSPPYYGLRDYGLPPLVWGGDPEHEHEWTITTRQATVNSSGNGTHWQNEFNGQGRPEPGSNEAWSSAKQHTVESGFCSCGAWRGSHGLEPTPELYIQHEVEVFREVRRVLRDDGCMWVNLGDSYAGSNNGSNDSRADGTALSLAQRSARPDRGLTGGKTTVDQSLGGQSAAGYKAKDLMLMPFRVAMALQQDGWYLRSCIPWLKRNSMPESVRDRPATAVEYVFLLSKNARYFYDADAVRMPVSPNWSPENAPNMPKHGAHVLTEGHSGHWSRPQYAEAKGRSRRNSDWFFESWQGLLHDDEGEPLALIVNPAGFKEAHFATFPPKLVEPMVKAGTSEKGQCPECGAAWVRSIARDDPPADVFANNTVADDPLKQRGYRKNGEFRGSGQKYQTWLNEHPPTTTGWRATCSHGELTPVPQTVLDPFGGSGTSGLVADRLGRNAILCELNPSYSQMGAARIVNDNPLFTELSAD